MHATPKSDHIIYGKLPPFVVVMPNATQCSPLIPGSYTLETCAPESLQSLVMRAPAGTVERRYAMALALRALQPGAPFTILAPSDKGGKRLDKELREFGCPNEKTAQKHFRICSGTRPVELIGIDEAITEGAPQLLEESGLWSQPGVFSWNRLDSGSALLVKHLPALAGKGADLGCGIGYLSRAVLANAAVEHLTLVEVDRRATEMAARNVDAARSTVHWADVREKSNLPTNLDFVVMNPPFHDGGIEDRELGKQFIERAAALLKKGGVCWLVANRHLPYEAVMQPLFADITLKVETGGFKIYEARK